MRSRNYAVYTVDKEFVVNSSDIGNCVYVETSFLINKYGKNKTRWQYVDKHSDTITWFPISLWTLISFSLIGLLYTRFLANYKIFLADTNAQGNPLLSVQRKLLLVLVMGPHIVDPKKLIFISPQVRFLVAYYTSSIFNENIFYISRLHWKEQGLMKCGNCDAAAC